MNDSLACLIESWAFSLDDSTFLNLFHICVVFDEKEKGNVCVHCSPDEYGLYYLNVTLVTKGISLRDGSSSFTYLIFHPCEVRTEDYILKVRWNDIEYGKYVLLGSEKCVLVHIVP